MARLEAAPPVRAEAGLTPRADEARTGLARGEAGRGLPGLVGRAPEKDGDRSGHAPGVSPVESGGGAAGHEVATVPGNVLVALRVEEVDELPHKLQG